MSPSPESPSQTASLATLYLADVKARFESIKTTADRASAQVDDAAFFAPLGAEENSIALVMKHSRYTAVGNQALAISVINPSESGTRPQN